jgi:hypothetical protein
MDVFWRSRLPSDSESEGPDRWLGWFASRRSIDVSSLRDNWRVAVSDGTFSKKSADFTALSLIDSGHPHEWLVCRDGTEPVVVVAVVSSETGGVYAYPHLVPYRRLGPFESAEEALESCRAELGEAADGSPLPSDTEA